MHERLNQAEQLLGVDLPSIRRAAEQSRQALADARSAAFEHLKANHVVKAESSDLVLGLVAFGSLAREEASATESDFDHAVIAFKNVDEPEDIREYRRAAEVACDKTRLHRPGASRIFGGLITGSDLVNRIGLDDDTNRTHTQRMLFIEESTPIIGVAGHTDTMRSILRRYLFDYRKPRLDKIGVPRFLLNDVVRYWRTIAVDYQAKRWDEVSRFLDAARDHESPKWGTRYLKLRSTRKLAFCGTFVSLLIPRLESRSVTEDLLAEQFAMPPLARLAQLAPILHEDDRRHLADVLVHADWFIDRFGDTDFRDGVNQVEHPRDPENKEPFKGARRRADDLESALESLFGSNRPLSIDNDSPLQGYMEALSLQQLTARYLLF